MPNGVPADTHMTPLGMITLVELTKLHEKHWIAGLIWFEWAGHHLSASQTQHAASLRRDSFSHQSVW